MSRSRVARADQLSSRPFSQAEDVRSGERTTADDWQEESSRQARKLETGAREPHNEFAEFRRKLAAGELVSRSAEKLAAALRFSGRITVTFHQGRITKTLLEEAYFPGRTGS